MKILAAEREINTKKKDEREVETQMNPFGSHVAIKVILQETVMTQKQVTKAMARGLQ